MTALAAAGLAVAVAASAEAHFDGPQLVPQVPGVGKPTGVVGPPPQIEITGGRVSLWRRSTIHIRLRCSTATKGGCRGALNLSNRAGRAISSAAFDIEERQRASVFLKLPPRAGRARGWRLRATACAADTLGRRACTSAAVVVRGR